MKTHRHDSVNPLVNPVQADDRVISESGERYIVRQNMRGDYWLQHASGANLTQPVSGQVAICRQIADLVNV
jgi:hypothetical protein